MTAAEARHIQTICNDADGQCYWCAASLCKDLMQAFPEHAKVFKAEYQKQWPDQDPENLS